MKAVRPNAVKDPRVRKKRAARELGSLIERAASGELSDEDFRAGAERAGWAVIKFAFFAFVTDEGALGELLRDFIEKLSDPRDELRRDIPYEQWAQLWPALNIATNARRQYLERVREGQEGEQRGQQTGQQSAPPRNDDGAGALGTGSDGGVQP